jgi:hypothetical protein
MQATLSPLVVSREREIRLQRPEPLGFGFSLLQTITTYLRPRASEYQGIKEVYARTIAWSIDDYDYIFGASGYLVASGARSRPPQWK